MFYVVWNKHSTGFKWRIEGITAFLQWIFRALAARRGIICVLESLLKADY
jgi:hypothetical protein